MLDATTMLSKCMFRVVFLLFFSVCLVACADASKAEQGMVVTFHRQLDDQAYRLIWEETDANYRRAMSERGNERFLSAIHRKLGKVRSSTLKSWNYTTSTQGKLTRLTYATIFERGKGTETFLWHDLNGQPYLRTYYIDSLDLIEK